MRDELATIPKSMADAVRALLPEVTIAGYQCFLDHMYHYTRGSEARLLHAAAHAGSRTAYFAELAADERSQYRLAEADLAAFGRTISEAAPPAVAVFDRIWRTWTTPGWLGALYALESVAAHISNDAQRHLGRLGIAKDQARFILVHLSADAAHGADAVRQLSALAEPDAEAARAAAWLAAEFWIELHVDAFRSGSDPIL